MTPIEFLWFSLALCGGVSLAAGFMAHRMTNMRIFKPKERSSAVALAALLGFFGTALWQGLVATFTVLSSSGTP